MKYWKSKNISSSKWIFEEIWWQVKTLRNKTEEKTDETNESYIILMRAKNHLWSEINSTMTCINEKFRKASQIRKIEEKTNLRTVIKYIRNN